MLGDKIIEVSKFIISYDGIYKIRFEYEGEHYQFMICMMPEDMMQLWKNEGYLEGKEVYLDYSIDVHFQKSTLLFTVFNPKKGKRYSFLTSELASETYLYLKLTMIDVEIKRNW